MGHVPSMRYGFDHNDNESKTLAHEIPLRRTGSVVVNNVTNPTLNRNFKLRYIFRRFMKKLPTLSVECAYHFDRFGILFAACFNVTKFWILRSSVTYPARRMLMFISHGHVLWSRLFTHCNLSDEPAVQGDQVIV